MQSFTQVIKTKDKQTKHLFEYSCLQLLFLRSTTFVDNHRQTQNVRSEYFHVFYTARPFRQFTSTSTIVTVTAVPLNRRSYKSWSRYGVCERSPTAAMAGFPLMTRFAASCTELRGVLSISAAMSCGSSNWPVSSAYNINGSFRLGQTLKIRSKVDNLPRNRVQHWTRGPPPCHHR